MADERSMAAEKTRYARLYERLKILHFPLCSLCVIERGKQ